MSGGTPLASAFIRIRPDTEAFRREAEQELGRSGRRAGEEFGDEFNESLRRNTSETEDTGQQTGRRFGAAFADSLKVAAGVAIAGLGEKAAATLSTAFTAALDLGAAEGKLQAQLGLTATESKRIGGVAGKLFSAAYGESMEDVNAAVTSVIQNMDGMKTASSDALESTTARALTVSQVLGEDVGAVTQAVSQLMRTGLAANSQQAFDIITKGAQSGANASGDLLDTIVEYSTQFRAVGLDGPKAMGLLSQAVKAGARDLDTAADAIKEFAIRSKDGSDTSAAAFKGLGLDSDKMFKTFAKGGPASDAAFTTVVTKLKAIKDPLKQNALATALFGTKSEDLQKALFSLNPAQAVKDFGDLKGATDKASDAMGNTAASRFEAFKRSLQTGVVTFIADNVIPVVENLAKSFSGMGGSASGVAAAAVPLVGIGIAAKVSSVAVGAVKSGISGIVTAGKGIGAAASGVGRFASGFRSADAASSAFSGKLGTLGGKTRSVFNAAASGARTAATATLSAASAAGTAALAWTRNAAATALSTARTVAAAAVQKAVAIATRSWAIAQAALNIVMSANPIALVVIGIAALIAIVVVAYKKSETFKRIVDAAFRGIATAGKFMWNTVLKPIFAAISFYITKILIPYYKLLWTVVKTVFSGIVNAISGGWSKIKGFFSRLGDGIKGVGRAFGTGASAIRTAWNKVQDYTKKPINFVIGTVYNKGIVGLWNKVMGWLHLPGSLKLNTLPQLASGGPMPVRPGVFNKPTAIVGEGNTNYPEYVIPTDPKYRSRAQALWNAAGGSLQMFDIGGIIGSVKKFAGKAVNLGKDALDLITNPGKVWDRLVSALPSAEGLRTSPFGNAAAEMPKLILKHAKDYALKLFKAFGSGYGGDGGAVVNAALKYIGQGDDRGMDNNNIFTRQWGWPAGTPWCALFASTAIKDAGAGKKYGGYPTAAVEGFEAGMKHVGLGDGRAGDLATYGPGDHVNIIIKKAAGGYDTVGGNQGPVVNRYVRGGQATVLRPLAAGGAIDPRKLSGGMLRTVFRQDNPDPNDRNNPILKTLREQRRPLFDDGGFGVGWPFHKSKPEAVFTDQQWGKISKLASGGSRPPIVVNLHGVSGIPTEKQIVNAIEQSTTMFGRW